MPYAEVPLEYPPPNLPLVIAPRIVDEHVRDVRVRLRCAHGRAAHRGGAARRRCATEGSAAAVTRRRGRRGAYRRLRALLLAHGAIAIQRLDAIVALLLVLMVRAAMRRDDATLGFWGGLIGATKFVPILVLPVLVIASGVRGAQRLAAIALGATAGLALGLGPMIVMGRESLPLGPRVSLGAWPPCRVDARRRLRHREGGRSAGPRRSLLDYGSFNFHGQGRRSPRQGRRSRSRSSSWASWRTRAARSTTARPAPTTDRETDPETARITHIVLAALAATTRALARRKGLLSAVPHVGAAARPRAPGARVDAVSVALGLVVLVSQIYLRGFYDHVYNQWPAGVITMVVRLALLAALSRMLLVRLRRSW